MSEREWSFQRSDPVGWFGARPLTTLAAVATSAYGLAATIGYWRAVAHPWFMMAALACILGSSALIVIWSSPLRAPFPGGVYATVIALGIAAIAFAALASWNGEDGVRDDWAPLAAGMVLLQLVPYRYPRQLAVAATFTGIAAGLAGLLGVGATDVRGPIVVVATAAGPLLVIALAGVAFAATFGASFARHPFADHAELDESDERELRGGIARAVRKDRVEVLGKDVIPLFTELLSRGALRPGDRERAAAIANEIRAIMVAEADRSWLESLVVQAILSRGGSGVRGPSATVGAALRDPHHHASAMTTQQRTALRAFVQALFEHPAFRVQGFGIDIAEAQQRCIVELTAVVDEFDAPLHASLGPYLAVMRGAFPDLSVRSRSPALTLKFSYDH